MQHRTENLAAVTIVEPDSNRARSLCSALGASPGISGVEAHEFATQALLHIRSSAPSAVFLTMHPPDMDGVRCASIIKAHCPNTRVIMHSVKPSMIYSRDVQQNSIDLYLFGDFNAKGYVDALWSVLTPGKIVRDRNHSDAVQKRVDISNLNRRETAVLNLLAKGLLYKEIAAQLEVSVAVVHKLQHRIFLKLNVVNRTEAARAWWASS